MTDKQKIRTEIERQISALPTPDVHTTVGADSIRQRKMLEGIINFIDSLPEEPVSELWYDSNKEQPKAGSNVAIWDGESGEILTRCVKVNPNRKWAYMEDLLGKKEESASKEFTFKALPRLLDMIQPSDKAKTYIAKLADSLDKQGYHTDANIVRESIRIINGEKVAMATMDEEPVSESLEIAGKEWLRPQLDKSYANYGETKMMELTHFDGYAMLDAIEFGANWQKEKLIEKACEWLRDNVNSMLWIMDFRKAMEE